VENIPRTPRNIKYNLSTVGPVDTSRYLHTKGIVTENGSARKLQLSKSVLENRKCVSAARYTASLRRLHFFRIYLFIFPLLLRLHFYKTQALRIKNV